MKIVTTFFLTPNGFVEIACDCNIGLISGKIFSSFYQHAVDEESLDEIHICLLQATSKEIIEL